MLETNGWSRTDCVPHGGANFKLKNDRSQQFIPKKKTIVLPRQARDKHRGKF
eukprot:COSAG06_NODE_19306_length_844_cov_1.051007_2_plen_51_part_01